MRILIIRHGDPDYEIDGLTEKGKLEAELLAKHLENEKIDTIYCSPHGRAQLTAKPFADNKGLEIKTEQFLREFGYVKVKVPYKEKPKSGWDFLPDFINDYPELFDRSAWRDVPFIKESDYAKCYDTVTSGLDRILESHGYKRNGIIYDALNSNRDTIAFVCHHGLGSLLISHLINCAPFSISQNCCMLTSTITTFYSEERVQGKAFFRMCGYSDISHLQKGNEPPSFSGRFCECFDDDTRH